MRLLNIMGIKQRSLLGTTTPRVGNISEAKIEPSKLEALTMTHCHIRWSGKVLLDWQSFGTPEEAKASARQLVRQGETYTIEEHDETCSRCQAAMNANFVHSSFNEASA